jgi:uncharacterized protein (TIGR03437 family)
MKGLLALVIFGSTVFAQTPHSLGSIFNSDLSTSLPHADSVSVSVNAVTNGASFQPGVSSGSWVTIQGNNLANTNPGRIWRGDEIVNGNLPTALDGVSVTINNKPAFVYYISPTQINVQAPTDTSVGPVNVVVSNNGSISSASTAQLQTFAPAFFQYSGTPYAIATRYPDNALIANPGAIAGTVAAKPNDVLILWGTGFGPTNPAVPAGVVVTGAPAATTTPTITLNNAVNAAVLNTVLSPGSAGLYQIAIQLPPNTPIGDVTITASVGGVQSLAGIKIFVSQ